MLYCKHMDLLSLLTHALGGGQQHPKQQQSYTPAQSQQGYRAGQIPVGQSIPQDVMDSYSPQTKALAQIYQSNPRDPRVAHLDPAMFGYAPDNGTAAQQGYRPGQIAVGQPIPQDVMDSFSPQTRQLAQIYQSNPQDPRVAHIDPAQFGYAPDNNGTPQQSYNQSAPKLQPTQYPQQQRQAQPDFLQALSSLFGGHR